MDLLLYLVRRHEVEITKIALADITEKYLEYIDIRNTKPIRPKVGVKMKKFVTRISFGPAVEGGPIVMRSVDVAIKLSAFLVVRVDETQSVRLSDFEYAGDAG